MNLRVVFIFNAIVAGFFAIVSLLIPVTMLSWYAVPSNPEILLMTRFFGSALVALSLLTFYLRNVDMSESIKSVVLALLISDIVGLIVALMAQFAGTLNSLGWTTVIIYGLLSIGYLSVYMKK
jgi:RsiW-degrading membrane proteinase PrsW (M82 family)